MPTSRRSGSRRSAPTARRSSFAAFRHRRVDELTEALGDKITVQTSDWNCGGVVDPEPQAKAVRRRPGAPRPDLGDRPLGRRAGAVQDRDRAYGRRRRLSRLAAGRDQGGAAADRRLLARHREVAGRGEAPAEGGRGRGAQLRAAQPQRRPALSNIIGIWVVDQWSKIGLKRHPAGACRPARGSRRCAAAISMSALEGNCQNVVNPLARCRQIPAAFGVQLELRPVRRSDGNRDVRQAAARDSTRPSSAPICAEFEKHVLDEQAHAIYLLWWQRVVPHRSYVKGWKIGPSHYRQSGSRDSLARQMSITHAVMSVETWRLSRR